MADPKIEMLRQVPLFGSCRSGSLERIATLADEIDVPPGKVLMRQGGIGHEFFIIVSGEVAVERDGRLIRTLGPGDFLGEIALVDDQPRSATATATQASRLLVVGHNAFHSLLDEFPAIQLEVLQALARRVRHLEPSAQ
jgi:CRP/FNR family cyclic AMP-dependent transcriptional regulator